MEDDDFIQPVQEFGTESTLDLGHHLFLHRFITLPASLYLVPGGGKTEAGLALNKLHAGITGHDDDTVLEVHGAAVSVRQPAVIQQLEQDVEHVRVCFLNLIEQDNPVGTSPDRLGQLTAFLETDVTRRSTDQSGNGMFFLIL